MPNQVIPQGIIENIANKTHYWQADAMNTWTDQHIGMGALLLWNRPEAVNASQPFQLHHCVTVADARIDNRDTLCQQLSCNPTCSDAELITRAYLKWHNACTEHLLGDFAFAIWNHKTQALFCARDHMGVRPLHYCRLKTGFAFATEIKALLHMPGMQAVFDDTVIAQQLTTDIMMTCPYREETLYQHIKRVLPAHQLHVTANSVYHTKYWDIPLDKPVRFKKQSDYVDAFQAHLDEATKARCTSQQKVFSELSGGIDSSSVTASAALSDKNLTAITHTAPKNTQYLDETDHAKQLCEYANIKHHCLVDAKTFKLSKAIALAVQTADCPLLVVNPMLSYPIMETVQAQNGGVLLSGFGGDECVTGHGHYIKYEFCRDKKWLALFKEYRNRENSTWFSSIRSTAALYIKQQHPKLYALLRPHTAQPTTLNHLMINPNFSKRMSIATQFSTFAQMQHFDSIQAYEQAMLTGQSAWHLRARIESANLAAIPYRLEYRYPLLDIRLLTFCINLPANLKRQQGCGRYIARLALENRAPKTLQWRQDKAGSPVPGALHCLDEQGQLKQLLKTTEFSERTKAYLGNIKLELLDHKDPLIRHYAMRSSVYALQLQLLQEKLEKIFA